jgi:hypothetical protein
MLASFFRRQVSESNDPEVPTFVVESLRAQLLACRKNNRTTKSLKLAARVKSRAPCGIRLRWLPNIASHFAARRASKRYAGELSEFPANRKPSASA